MKPEKPSVLWKPVQRIRLSLLKRLGLIPAAEVEVLFQQVILLQVEVQAARRNFANILHFMGVTNENLVIHTRRIMEIEALIKEAKEGEGGGGYVQ